MMYCREMLFARIKPVSLCHTLAKAKLVIQMYEMKESVRRE